MTEVECPDCGIKVDKRGLSSHRGSRRCKSRAKRKGYEEDGYELVPSTKLKNYLKEEGFEDKIEYDICGYQEGGRGRTGYFRYGYYAPKNLIDEYEGEVLSGTHHQQFKKVIETEEYIAVRGKLRNDLIPFKKDEKGKTRKRKFKVEDEILYTNDGYKFGERVYLDEVSDEMREKMLVEKL